MTYLFLFIAGAIAWVISTVAAGGGATFLIPVVGFMLGAQLVPPVISIAAIIANPSRVFFFFPYINWKVIWFIVPGSLIGAAIGAWSFTQINVQLIQVILGVFLLTYVFQYKFSKTKINFKMKLPYFFPLGLVASFFSGLIGATGPVLNPFMLNYGLEKEQLVATKSMNSFVMQLTKLMTYSLFGALTLHTFMYGVILGVGAVFGVYFAKHHLLHIEPERFRNYTLAIMAISGVLMLYKAFY